LLRLFGTVLLAVFFGCLARVVHGVLVMPMSRVRMVSSFLVLARFVMFRRFFVMPCGLLVVLGGFAMMLCGLSRHARRTSFRNRLRAHVSRNGDIALLRFTSRWKKQQALCPILIF
jgi:hypothetical protein